MHQSRPWARALLLAAVLLTTSCRDSTGPETQPRIVPGEAAPYSMAHIEDLPTKFQNPSTQVQIASVTTPLVFDSAASKYGFLVPDLPAGPAEATLTSNGTTVRIPFTIAAPVFLGGSAEATTETLDTKLDEALSSLSYLTLRVPPADSNTAVFLGAYRGILVETQKQMEALDPEGKRALAAFLAAHPAFYRLVTEDLATALRGLEPIRPAFNRQSPSGTVLHPSASFAGSAATVPGLGDPDRYDTPRSFTEHCITRMDEQELLSASGDAVTLAQNAALLLLVTPGGQAIFPVVEGLLTAGDLLLKARLAFIRLDAFLPNGSYVVAQPYQVAAGNDIAFQAFLKRISPNQAILSAPGSVGDQTKALADQILKNTDDVSTKLGRIRKAKSALLGSLIDLAVGALEAWADEKDIPILRRSGLTQLYFGPDLTPSFQPLGAVTWTAPAKALTVTATVPASTPLGVVGVSFDRSAHKHVNACAIKSELSDWRLGLNAFQVADAPAGLTLTGPDSVIVRQKSADTEYLRVVNQGRTSLPNLRVRLGALRDSSFREWTAPAGIEIRPSLYATSIGAGGSATVYLRITVSASAPIGSILVPVTVDATGTSPVTHIVQVRVESQLEDVVVNRELSTISLYDHGAEDGDSVRVELNGEVLESALFIRHAVTDLPVRYLQGRNVLKITALNEGRLRPNTAALILSHVVQGYGEQQYGLNTDEAVTLLIVYDPTRATQSSMQRATPRYNRSIEKP